MPYDHSFGSDSEFYCAPSEPYDTDAELNSKGQPISLYGAIVKLVESLPPAKLAELSALVKSDPDTSTFAWELLDVAKKTNTCSNLSSPVEVSIDPSGSFRVKVYPND